MKTPLLFYLLLYQHLSDMYFGVRNKCLQLLGCLGMVDSPLSKDGEGPVSFVGLPCSAKYCLMIGCEHVLY